MLQIKTLNPQVKNPDLIRKINACNISRTDIAECLGMSVSWFSTLLRRKKFNKHDSDVVKKVIKVLEKRGEK